MLSSCKSVTPSLPKNKSATPPGSASATHAALWQWDARRSTPPNFALLSTAPWSACLLREGLSRITAECLPIVSGDLSSGYSGSAVYVCRAFETRTGSHVLPESASVDHSCVRKPAQHGDSAVNIADGVTLRIHPLTVTLDLRSQPTCSDAIDR